MPIGKKYAGAEKVTFTCIIERGDFNNKKDIRQTYEDVKGSRRIESFRDEVARDYKLPGRISLHRDNGKEVYDDLAFIGDIVATEKTVRIRYDENQVVANGGFATGAEAFSMGDNMAFAAGAYAEGGSVGLDSAVGGGAFGGKGFGTKGRGGEAAAGTANNPRGLASQGEVIGGKFYKNKDAKSESKPEKSSRRS
jgi:hypothetical protein